MFGDTGFLHGVIQPVVKKGVTMREELGTYDVFVRDWWKYDDKGNRVPYPGAPKKYIARGVSFRLAKELCEEYRAKNDPGPLSRKAEFEEC